MQLFDSIEIEDNGPGIPDHLMKFDHSILEKEITRELVELRSLQVGIGYTLINSKLKYTNWVNSVAIEASLKDDLTGQIVGSATIKAFDLTAVKPPARFENTKIAFFRVLLLNENYTLTFKSKFAAMPLLDGYSIYLGGAEVYLSGQRYRSVYFEPTRQKPYSANESLIIKLDMSKIISQRQFTSEEIKKMYL